MKNYIEMVKVAAQNHKQLLVRLLVCAAVYICLFAYNVANSPVPLTGISYDATTFRGQGVFGAVANWVSYDFKDKRMFVQTDWFGRRSYYYTMGENRFDYNPVTQEWVQTR